MAFARPKKREPVGEAGLFEYAVGTLARRMRTVRDLRRLMKSRAEEGEAGEQAMDAVIVRLKELNYLSDTRFAEDYTRVRKEHEKFGKRRVQQDLMMKGVGKELVASTLDTAYEDVDEVVLARQYIARKRMKQPSGEECPEGDGSGDEPADAGGVFFECDLQGAAGVGCCRGGDGEGVSAGRVAAGFGFLCSSRMRRAVPAGRAHCVERSLRDACTIGRDDGPDAWQM